MRSGEHPGAIEIRDLPGYDLDTRARPDVLTAGRNPNDPDTIEGILKFLPFLCKTRPATVN